MGSNLDLLWKLYIIYIYLPHIIGALLVVFALNVLVRIALHKFFKLRLPKWWQNNTLIPLTVAASCVLLVIAGGILLAKGRYDWDHQYTAESQHDAKALSFDVYMPDYVPYIQKIFNQSIATSSKGQKYFFTQYGNQDDESGVVLTEFNAKNNQRHTPCSPSEPDNDSYTSTSCDVSATLQNGSKLYVNEFGDFFTTIDNTKLVLGDAVAIDQTANPRTSEKVKTEVVKLFNSLHKVDPTKLEYVDRSNMHAAN